jgi:hypothetical protein
MNPIERLTLKSLKFLIRNVVLKQEISIGERVGLMNELDTLENNERRNEPCCKMPKGCGKSGGKFHTCGIEFWLCDSCRKFAKESNGGKN